MKKNADLPPATGLPGQPQVTPAEENPFKKGGKVTRSPKQPVAHPGTVGSATTRDEDTGDEDMEVMESHPEKVDLASKIRDLKAGRTASPPANRPKLNASKKFRQGTPEPEDGAARASRKKNLANLTINIREKLKIEVKNRAEKIKELAPKNTSVNVKTLTEDIIQASAHLEKHIIYLVTEFLEDALSSGGKVDQEELEELYNKVEEQDDLLEEAADDLRKANDKIADLEKTISEMRALGGQGSLVPVVSKEEIEKAMTIEISEAMKQAKDLHELLAITEKKWPREVFKRTAFTKAGVGANRKCRILLHSPEDKDSRTEHILKHLAQSYPAVKEIDTLEIGEVATTAMTVKPTLTRAGGLPPEEDKSTLVIGRIPKEANTEQIAEVLKRIFEETDKVCTDEDKILMSIPRSADATRLRKIAEACIIYCEAKGAIEISTKAAKGEEPGNKEGRRPQKPSHTTVMIGSKDRTFAEVLKNLKEKVNPRELGVDIRGCSQAGEEVQLQIRETSRGGRERLQAYVADALNYETVVRGPRLPAALLLTGLEPLITEDEVATELRKLLRHKDAERLKVEKIGRNARGTRITVVRLAYQDADRLVKMRTVQIGWRACFVQEWIQVPRCFRCQKAGHRTSTCKGKEETEKRCQECGLAGHTVKECKTEPEDYHCVNCDEKGHPGFSGACPKYREILAGLRTQAAQWRKEREARGNEAPLKANRNQRNQETEGTASQLEEGWQTQGRRRRSIRSNSDNQQQPNNDE